MTYRHDELIIGFHSEDNSLSVWDYRRNIVTLFFFNDGTFIVSEFEEGYEG